MRRNKKNVIELVPILKDRFSFTNDKSEALSIQHLEISRTQKALATSNQSRKFMQTGNREPFLTRKLHTQAQLQRSHSPLLPFQRIICSSLNKRGTQGTRS